MFKMFIMIFIFDIYMYVDSDNNFLLKKYEICTIYLSLLNLRLIINIIIMTMNYFKKNLQIN